MQTNVTPNNTYFCFCSISLFVISKQHNKKKKSLTTSTSNNFRRYEILHMGVYVNIRPLRCEFRKYLGQGYVKCNCLFLMH